MPERSIRTDVLVALVLLAVLEAAWVGHARRVEPAEPAANPIDLVAAAGLPPAALFLVLAVAAWLAIGVARRAWWIMPADPSPRAPWSGASFVVAWLLPFVAGGILVSAASRHDLLPFWIGVAGGREADAADLARIVADAAARGLCIAMVVWPIRRTGFLPALGWRAPGAFRQVGGAVVQLAAFVPPFALVYGASLAIHRALGVSPDVQAVVTRVLEAGIDTPLFMALAVSAVLVAPLWEEILYRGLLYSGLRRTRDVRTSVVISAAVFALAHLNAFVLLPLFAFGVLLALVRERTGSLLAPVVIHMLFNAVQLALMKSG